MRSTRLAGLLAALAAYRSARAAFLSELGCDFSNRDPLAEFSENLVAAVLDGDLAASRVQKGYDLITPAGERVQVRYLANPADRWVNEHLVDFRGECDRYALVTFEAFDPTSILIFERSSLEPVCAALGKRHGGQDALLQLTRRNYLQLLTEHERFAGLGVMVVDLAAPRP